MPTRVAYRQNDAWRVYGGYNVPPPTPQEYRNTLVTGNFFPNPGTVGIYSTEAELTTVTGTNTLYSNNSTNNGAYIENMDFRSLVTVRAAGMTFRNCFFRGRQLAEGTVQSFSGALVDQGTSITFIDCTFEPTTHRDPPLYGRNFTAIRCEFRFCEDGVRVLSLDSAGARADVRLEACWIHDLVAMEDTVQTDGITHNDAIQWQGGKGLTVLGSRLEAFYTDRYGEALNPDINYLDPLSMRAIGACIMMNKAGSRDTPDELVFDGNWLNGGAVGINNSTGVGSPLTAASSITNNRYGWDSRLGQDYMTFGLTGGAFTFSGNVRWGGSEPWVHGTVSGTDPNYVWTPSGSEDIVDPFDSSTPFTTRH